MARTINPTATLLRLALSSGRPLFQAAAEQTIETELAKAGGSVPDAAAALGIGRRALERMRAQIAENIATRKKSKKSARGR